MSYVRPTMPSKSHRSKKDLNSLITLGINLCYVFPNDSITFWFWFHYLFKRKSVKLKLTALQIDLIKNVHLFTLSSHHSSLSSTLSVFWQITVALPPAVGTCSAQHPLEQALLGLALGGQNLLAQLIEDLGHLVHMIGGRDLAEFALKVLGQDLALVAAHLTQVHHVHFVGTKLDGCVRLKIGFGTAYIVEALAIRYGVDQEQAIGPLDEFGGIGVFVIGLEKTINNI